MTLCDRRSSQYQTTANKSAGAASGLCIKPVHPCLRQVSQQFIKVYAPISACINGFEQFFKLFLIGLCRRTIREYRKELIEVNGAVRVRIKSSKGCLEILQTWKASIGDCLVICLHETPQVQAIREQLYHLFTFLWKTAEQRTNHFAQVFL